jgi:lipoic acid synthetase
VARYDRSLSVLQIVKKDFPKILTKSGLMLGLGETHDEVVQAMKDLRSVNCQLLTLGQYLQPSKNHWSVSEYVHPDQFKEYERLGREMGFKAVFAGPFVRSSYLADNLIEYLGGRGESTYSPSV